MTSPTAFRATFSDMKLVKTRQVAQLIFEIPLEDFDPAYEVLGGVPIPGKERWFGIAALQTGKEAMPDNPVQPEQPGRHNARPLPESDKPTAGAKREKMDWRDVQPAAQAGIRCDDAVFIAFLVENYPEDFRAMKADAAETVRYLCGVNSRSELGTKHAARMIWKALDDQYLAWKAVEHA